MLEGGDIDAPSSLVEPLVSPVRVHSAESVDETVVLSHVDCVKSCQTSLLTGPSVTWTMKLNKLLSGPKPVIPLPTFTIVYNKCNICNWWLSLLLLCKQMNDRIHVLCLNYYCYLTICVITPVFLTVRLRTFFCLTSIICWVRFEPAKMPKISSSSSGVHYVVSDTR